MYRSNPHIIKTHGDIFHGRNTYSSGGNGKGTGKGNGNGNGSHLLHSGQQNGNQSGSGVALNLGDSEDSDFERIN